MHKPTRQEIFEEAAKRLRQDFESLRRVIPHAASKGAEAEHILRTFLNDHLPGRFRAGAGFIIDVRDEVSPQTDIVIYDAFHCPVYHRSQDVAIFPSNNVAAVVEVKSVLDRSGLADAHRKSEAIKGLAKTWSPAQTSQSPTPVLEQTMTCLFAFQSTIKLEKIREYYSEMIKESGIGHHIDIIVVLDLGIITLSAHAPGVSAGWAPMIFHGIGGSHSEGTHIGLSSSHLGYDTLDAFFRILLADLAYFRGGIDHPGFNWRSMRSEGLAHVQYLTTMCHEQDPNARNEKMQRYFQDACKILGVRYNDE